MLLQRPISSAQVVQYLSNGRISYAKLWDVVRRARKRANRKYRIWREYDPEIPHELLTRWITRGILRPDNFNDILTVLCEYREYLESVS